MSSIGLTHEFKWKDPPKIIGMFVVLVNQIHKSWCTHKSWLNLFCKSFFSWFLATLVSWCVCCSHNTVAVRFIYKKCYKTGASIVCCQQSRLQRPYHAAARDIKLVNTSSWSHQTNHSHRNTTAASHCSFTASIPCVVILWNCIWK